MNFTSLAQVPYEGVDAPVARIRLDLLNVGMNDAHDVRNESFERVASAGRAREPNLKEPEIDVAGSEHRNLT
ncbi:hypothetical protein RN51_00858 [Microbacterium oxydans]|uniref:Uncharacterized protein n=1 Tax=Microbacterium oxydans TaxID=82380 RepID=A0A0F0KVX8_9MICO|nr:hypothetical protein RN51_00858 [Microbacterium oxydans]